jgi:Domain of unknown function (DUF4062)
MDQRGRQLRVFVASPGDVVEERTRMDRVVTSLNQTIGDAEGVHIELVRWETHAWPGFGADAQDVINRQIAPGDIFVGVLWRRIGTPTQRAVSGTVEEFETAHALWLSTGRPTLMLYFCTTPFLPTEDDLTQFSGVLEFKRRVAEKGALYWEYDGADEFEDTVRTHLYKAVHAEIRNSPRDAPEDPVARDVLAVLESSSNVGQGYRTVMGLARATGFSESEIERVITSLPGQIMRSRIPDAHGADLYKLIESPQSKH